MDHASETRSDRLSKSQDEIDVDADADADAILAELEADDDPNLILLQQQRIQEQMQLNKNAINSAFVSSTGAKQDLSFQTLKSDDETLQFTTEHEKAILHFFHPDFARCSIMDEHLTQIAQKHDEFGTNSSEVKFARVDVGHAAFVVQKLGIRVLPCVIGFEKGAIKGRIVGFEGLCWDGREKDVRVMKAVEERMVDWGILRKALLGKHDDLSDESDGGEKEARQRKVGRRGISGRKQEITDEDDDWD